MSFKFSDAVHFRTRSRGREQQAALRVGQVGQFIQNRPASSSGTTERS